MIDRILVTGGAGFIGSHLCERLLADGKKVYCIDNFNNFYDPAIKRKNISAIEESDKFSIFEGDIRDKVFINDIFEAVSPDAVVHLAAMAGVRPSLSDPILYNDVNIIGTNVILEAITRKPVKNFVFGSSSSVYGEQKKTPFSEKDHISRPVSPYASTKLSGEQLCYTYHHLFDIPVTCLRFFTVYGPRQRPEMAIHKFARHILEGKPIDVYGDGSTRRDYTYIDDIIDGVNKALFAPHDYEIFNLGESRTVKLNELIDIIEGSLGKKAEKNLLPEQPGDVPVTFADIEKARGLLGYDPVVQIEEGVEMFKSWFIKGV